VSGLIDAPETGSGVAPFIALLPLGRWTFDPVDGYKRAPGASA
jgi:hypothetical protein